MTRVTKPAIVADLVFRATAMLLMARPSQLALIALVYVNGVLFGLLRSAELAIGAVAAGALLLLAAAASVHWANEYADVDTDALTRRTPVSGGSGMLPRSGIDRRLPLLASGVAASMALAGGVWLAAAGILPRAALVILAIGLIGGLAYSLPPAALARRGLGELANALLGGLLLPLYGVAIVVGAVALLDAVVFLPFAIVVFLSVIETAWPDRHADAATGKLTLQTRLPAPSLRRIHAGSIALFVLAVAIAVDESASFLPAWALTVLPFLLVAHRRYTVTEMPLAGVAAMVLLAIQNLIVFSAYLTGGFRQ